MEQLLQVGVITQPHGVRGEVKVFPTTDDPVRFKKLKKVILDTGKEKLDLEVEHVKFFKQFVIVKFKEFDNINDIERYKRCPLLVTRENAVPLEEDEYFVADMIGMKVITEDGTESKEHGEVLMPAIKECVLNVDMESGIITVHLMNGLI